MSPRCRRSPRSAATRSAGRWVGLGATAVVTAAVLNVAPSVAPAASAADCPDAEVVFARGTDEPKGMGSVGDAFVDSLRKQAIGNIGTYAVNYDAGKLQLGGRDGAKDAVSHIKSTLSSCPDTKIVLGGYSQGASVVDIVAGIPVGPIQLSDPLPSALADNVAAVVTFGNVANRVGGTLPSSSALFAGRALELCNPADPICHAGPGNAWSGHTEGYVPGYTTQAAAFAASKLLDGTRQTVPGVGPMPGYASPPPGDQHMPPGYTPSSPVHGQAPGYQQPGYDPSLSGYSPSVVTGLP